MLESVRKSIIIMCLSCQDEVAIDYWTVNFGDDNAQCGLFGLVFVHWYCAVDFCAVEQFVSGTGVGID